MGTRRYREAECLAEMLDGAFTSTLESALATTITQLGPVADIGAILRAHLRNLLDLDRKRSDEAPVA